jgi:hypothetical protein
MPATNTRDKRELNSRKFLNRLWKIAKSVIVCKVVASHFKPGKCVAARSLTTKEIRDPLE